MRAEDGCGRIEFLALYATEEERTEMGKLLQAIVPDISQSFRRQMKAGAETITQSSALNQASSQLLSGLFDLGDSTLALAGDRPRRESSVRGERSEASVRGERSKASVRAQSSVLQRNSMAGRLMPAEKGNSLEVTPSPCGIGVMGPPV